MALKKSTVSRVLVGGFLLSILSCFFEYAPCACGALRGLPLPILDPHGSFSFFVASIVIDILIWGTIFHFAIKIFRWLEN